MTKEEMMNLSCEEIIAHVEKRMTDALMFHSQMRDYFNFLGLKGFKRWHQYQYFSESIGRDRLHNVYIKRYNKLIQTVSHDKVNIIPSEWYKHTRMDVDDSVLPKYVRNAMREYMNWEEETKQMYQDVCHVLMSHGNITMFEMMREYLCDVDKELQGLYKIQEELNCVGYDVMYIMEMQCWMHEKYKNKMKHLKA